MRASTSSSGGPVRTVASDCLVVNPPAMNGVVHHSGVGSFSFTAVRAGIASPLLIVRDESLKRDFADYNRIRMRFLGFSIQSAEAGGSLLLHAPLDARAALEVSHHPRAVTAPRPA